MLVTQSHPILCDPMDCSPPGSSVQVILQARILKWVAIVLLTQDLPDPGIESSWQTDSLLSEPSGKPKRFFKGSLYQKDSSYRDTFFSNLRDLPAWVISDANPLLFPSSCEWPLSPWGQWHSRPLTLSSAQDGSKASIGQLPLHLLSLWGSRMHIICFSPINLSSVNLIITPAKESRMEEKNPFLPQQWRDEVLAQGREGKEEGRKHWDEKEGEERRKRCQQLNQHYSLISKSALFYHASSQAPLEQIRVLKSLQLCLTLCDPIDCSPPGSSVHGILQARILEWVVIPSSRGSSRARDWTLGLLHLRLCRWIRYHWATGKLSKYKEANCFRNPSFTLHLHC